MRIGYDCRCLQQEKTGIGYYTYHLLRALMHVQPDNEFYLYSNCGFQQPGVGNNICKHTCRGLPGTVWLQTVLPLLLHKDKVSVFHAPLFIAPLLGSIPKLITVHDLSHYLYPEKTTWQNRYILRGLLPASIKAASAVIAVSENTKQDIVNYLGTSPEKITVIPLAASDVFRKISDQAELNRVRLKYDLPKDYILFVGTVEPRKNLERLLLAYKQVLDRRKDLPHHLVVVGKLGWQYDGIMQSYHRLRLKQRINFLGYVDEADLPFLYNSADAFVYPSLYEGFGLPVLEAMSCGVPVITSNVSSLPEVAGDSCYLVDPLCVEELADAIELVLENQELRERMGVWGQARALDFSWQYTAEETFKLYSKVQQGKISKASMGG